MLSAVQAFCRHLLIGAMLVASPEEASEPIGVDLALVLAIDVSASMLPIEQEMQRQGFIQAFRSPQVLDAITSGPHGRVAVAYVEWSGASDQDLVVPWSVIDGPEAALAFADRLAEAPTRTSRRTSISGAIDFSVALFARSNFQAVRRVIDISGDGANNEGRPVTAARDNAVASGIVVNGLPILLREHRYFTFPDLDRYYRDCVIGGRGAFMVPVYEREQFVHSIINKVTREISSHEPILPEPRVQLAQQDGSEPMDCFIGEKLIRERLRNN